MLLDLSKITFSENFKDEYFYNGVNSTLLNNADVVKVWNFPKSIVKTSDNAAYSCYGPKLDHLTDISNIDTSNIIYMYSTFKNAKNLTDISNLDLRNVIKLYYTFSNTGITSVMNLNDESLPKCKNIDYAFYNCKNLKEVGDISLSNNVNLQGAFRSCTNLEKVGNINLPNGTSTIDMFSGPPNVEIGNIYAPKATVKLTGKKMSNITASYISYEDSSSGNVLEEVGVINCINQNTNALSGGVSKYVVPLKIKAIALKVMNYYPNSTGYEYWVDCYINPTSYIKSILNVKSIADEHHIKVHKKNATFTIKLPYLEVNMEYPYKFELQTFEKCAFDIKDFICILKKDVSSSNADKISNEYELKSIEYSEKDKAIMATLYLEDITDDLKACLKIGTSVSYINIHLAL